MKVAPFFSGTSFASQSTIKNCGFGISIMSVSGEFGGVRECRIPLTKGLSAIVSEIDVPLVSSLSWHAVLSPAGIRYARAKVRAGRQAPQIFMHRLILGLNNRARLTDHIDGDGLNNTRRNIRPCSAYQNAGRRRDYRRPDKLRGAHPHRGMWTSQITHAGKRHYLGVFETEVAAAEAYANAAIALRKDFSSVPAYTGGGRLLFLL